MCQVNEPKCWAEGGALRSPVRHYCRPTFDTVPSYVEASCSEDVPDESCQFSCLLLLYQAAVNLRPYLVERRNYVLSQESCVVASFHRRLRFADQDYECIDCRPCHSRPVLELMEEWGQALQRLCHALLHQFAAGVG